MESSATPRAPKAGYRILIIEDHPLVRRGLHALIDNETGLDVCAEATHREGLDAVASSHPDLVITDLLVSKDDGFGLITDIRARYANLPVLVLSMYATPEYARRALRAGATGCVSKQEMGETLLNAIRCVRGGNQYISPKLQARLDSG